MIVDDLAERGNARPPRILTLDLERLPGRAELEIWEPRDMRRLNYLHPDRWHTLPSTLCASWKWWGTRRVEFAAAWDTDVPLAMWQAIDAADVVITFNGARADLKWLASDWVVAGMPRPRPYKHLDLYAVARREFSFESKSLRHLCDRLDLPNKSGHYDSCEAQAAMDGDETARRRLERYNKQDARVTEAAAARLRPWWPTSINLGAFYADTVPRCHACGSDDLEPDGWYTATQQRYGQYRCRKCQAVNRNGYIKSRTAMRGVK